MLYHFFQGSIAAVELNRFKLLLKSLNISYYLHTITISTKTLTFILEFFCDFREWDDTIIQSNGLVLDNLIKLYEKYVQIQIKFSFFYA